MMTVQDIKALQAETNPPFSGVFVLKRAERKTSRNGSPFLSVEFGDKYGSLHANCFDGTSVFLTLDAAVPGAVMALSGSAELYNDRLSPRLSHAQVLDDTEAEPHLEHLIEGTPEAIEDLVDDLNKAISDISHSRLREAVELAMEEFGSLFQTSTAALGKHHAYRNGLLEHTVHMVRNAQALLPLYPQVDPSLTLSGIILHDIGKILEYSQGLAAGKTRAGLLQGHVVLGYRIVRKAAIKARMNADLTERLEHIVLSHQGELEWGAAAMAATPEAVFVSMIDNLDAKMGMVQHALRNTPDDQEFSDYIPGLKAKLLVTPPELQEKDDADA